MATSNGTYGVYIPEVPLWIDNSAVYSDLKFDVVNSTSKKTVFRASGADSALAQAAVESSAKAFPGWARTHPTERRRLFFRAASLIRARQEEIVDIMMTETNCSKQWASGINMDVATEFLEELGALATPSAVGWLPPTDSEDRLALVFREPYGVVLGIAPWNAPFILAIRAVATPIVCGNTAILKASELSPRTHHVLGEIFRDAGFPPGVLNIVQHSREKAPEVITTLIAHPSVRKINFTGSTNVGKLIAQQAGLHLKPVLLELGGKASCIVLEDADLKKAAKAVVMGGFLHHGQICMATERVIVQESVAQAFLDELKRAAVNFNPGSAVTPQGAVRTEELVAAAIKDGAKLEFGEVSRDHATLKPTILTNITKDMELYYAESFGPTISIFTVKTVDETVTLANDTEYGLTSSIFSRNVSKAVKLARRIEAGACHINAMTVHDEPWLPHGGSKSSGYGRFGSRWGMDEFLQVKTVTIMDDS